ncbi:MAG: hypothetical protein QNJ97_03525 [Myxococcota bacterium]|nr:hypothetical protein [Myxococcota bacterium]
MFFSKYSDVLGFLIFGALFSIWIGCEATNTHSVGCGDADCHAACQTKGFAGGSCIDTTCNCNGMSDASYIWEDAGADASDGRPPTLR